MLSCDISYFALCCFFFVFFLKDHIEYCLQWWHFYDVPIRSEYTSVWDELSLLFLNVDNQCAIHMFISATCALWGGSMYNIIHSFHLVKCVYRVHRIYVSTCDIVLYSKWIKMIPKYTGRRNLKTSIPLQTALQNINILNKTIMVYTGFVVCTKKFEILICVIFLAINIKSKYNL